MTATDVGVRSSKPVKKRSTGAWVMRIVFLALGIAVAIAANSYGLENEYGQVGAGLLPFVAGIVMVLSTLVEIANSLRNERNPEANEEIVNAISDADQIAIRAKTSAQERNAVIVVFTVIVASVLLTYLIGLLIALTVMVFVLVFVVEHKKLVSALLAGIATFLFGFLVFKLALQVPLPTGILGLI